MSDEESRAQISFRLNGKSVSVRVPPRLNLVDLLRTEFRLTGSHVGCEHGVCGACNVMLDGVVVRGCLTFAVQADGRDVVTIEGLTANHQIHDLQEAFVQRNALQCGFCTPGMLMTAAELLARDRTPSREQIRDEIGGNYCRCTGYQAIVDAIETVVAQRSGRNAAAPPADTRSVIGASHARPNAARLAEGRGTYTDDVVLPGMAHVVFLRSPHAHARIAAIDTAAAQTAPGVIAVFTGADLAAVCPAWQTRLAMMPSHHSAPQAPLAVDEVCWQGEAVAAVVAVTRREAEDAAELIEVQWDVLGAVAGLPEALAPDAPLVHSAMANNLAIDHSINVGDTEKQFAEAAAVVEHSFRFERQTAVSLEPRCILASFDRNLGELTIYHSHQAPFQMREVFAEQLGLNPEDVRIVVKDVGGGFGLKLHAFADEMAVAAIATLVPVPVKFTADRLEAFVSDAHTREANVHGRMALSADGKILGIEIDMLAGFGAYSIYPRGSIGEVIQTLQMIGAPYEIGAYRGRVRGVFQNKPPTGAYRGVGQPFACTITEQLVDLGAAALHIDPAELRRRNYRRTGAEVGKTLNGIVVADLSLDACMETMLRRMNYGELREQQQNLRKLGIFARHRLIDLHRNNRRRLGAVRLPRLAGRSQRKLPPDARWIGASVLRNQHYRSGPGHFDWHRPDRGRPIGRGDRSRQSGDGRHRCRPLWRRRLGVARHRAWRRGYASRGAVVEGQRAEDRCFTVAAARIRARHPRRIGDQRGRRRTDIARRNRRRHALSAAHHSAR